LFKRNNSYFLIRFDDIHPKMNKKNFERVIDLMSKYELKGILGVIPDNQDKGLDKEKIDPDFWKKIRNLEKKGFWIAQHGYQHLYDSNDGGLLNLNAQSEFSGHPFEVQLIKMKNGKKILEQKGLKPRLFMPPSHSYDIFTLEAVRSLDYGLTDGYGLWPILKDGILTIPQLFASPRHLYCGLYTICLHTDNMKEKAFIDLYNHIKNNSKNYIEPNQIESFIIQKNQYGRKVINLLLTFAIKIVLKLKRNFS